MSTMTQQKNRLQSILVILKLQDSDVFGILETILEELSPYLFLRLYFVDEQFLKFTHRRFPNMNAWMYDPVKLEMQVDFVITIGGDGTILRAVGLFQNRPTPRLITFQKGTLGFLCKFELEEMHLIISNFIAMIATPQISNKLLCESKMRLLSTLRSGLSYKTFHCINQVAIARSNYINQIKLDIFVGNKLLTTVTGDGLLIATPTGSTAYSLSAGGPIVHSSIRAMIIVPISPTSLSFRPVVLPTKLPLKIRISSESRNDGLLSLDGQANWKFSKGDELVVSESQYDVKVLAARNEFSEDEFWTEKLKKLLHWNTNFSSLRADRIPKL